MNLPPFSPVPGGDAASGRVTPGRVLIVDDVAANIRLLSGILRIHGFEIMSAGSGAEALSILHDSPAEIDVVLLDVMMPNMDGFEVCTRIREQASTATLPVVMVTALRDTADRVRSLEVGADDFLTKPVEEIEVVARVRSLVRARRDRSALEKAYLDLKASEELRHFLAEMLVHDLRTPLTTVLVSLDLLRTEMEHRADSANAEILSLCNRSARHLLALINELLDISKLESSEMQLQIEELNPVTVVEDSVAHVEGQIRHYDTEILIESDPDLSLVPADEDLLRRVIINLLGNALKFARHKQPVRVAIARDETNPAMVLIAVQDDGDGIEASDQERIFSKFGQAELGKARRRTSTGLGLTFCKLVAEAHGGRIWVESVVGEGSTFKLHLPLQRAAREGSGELALAQRVFVG